MRYLRIKVCIQVCRSVCFVHGHELIDSSHWIIHLSIVIMIARCAVAIGAFDKWVIL